MIRPVRALPYREFSVAATFSPVRNEVVARVQDALVAVLIHPDAIGPRALVADAEPEPFATDAVLRSAERLSTTEAIERMRGTTSPGHPLRVLLSDERVTFAVSHASIDGLGMAELIGAVMAVAAGEQPRLDGRAPIRHPLLVGLRSVGIRGVVEFLRSRRSATIIGPDVAEGVRPGHSVALEMPVHAELLHRIDRLPSRGRSTQSARLAAIAVGALARVHRRAVDVPVLVPVSLLRHVGNRRVLGNFIGLEPLGTLHGSDWRPESITARLAAAVRSGRAMTGLVYTVARAARYAVIPGPVARSHRRVAVSMQIMALPDVMPRSAWVGEDWRTCAATIGPWPSSTALAPFRMGQRWGVSAWDESGDFDLGAFPEAFLAEIEAREASAAGLVP